MNRIGLLSDTHGHAEVAQDAVAILLRQSIDLLLHLGDVGSESVIDALAAVNPRTGKPLEVQLVFGNTDYDFADLGRYARSLGMTDAHPVGRLATPAGELVFLHGDDFMAMDGAVAGGAAFVCHGHTHLAQVSTIRKTKVINPGALHRASRYSVAVLDTPTGDVKFHEVPRR